MIEKTLQLGALCDPISKQLAGFAPAEELARLDVMNNAITTCYVHGLIGDAEGIRARKRMLKKVHASIAKANTTLSHAGTSARKQDGAATGVGSGNS